MNLETPYSVTYTRSFYTNLHLSYRVNDTGRGMNGPIFGREFCGGGNGNGMIYRQREVRGGCRCGYIARNRHDIDVSL